MKAITVRQPWAWAIIYGGKDVENRTRNIAGEYRGPVAIHAGLTDDRKTPAAATATIMWRDWWNTNGRPGGQRGSIIGVVDIVGVVTPHERCNSCSDWGIDDHHQIMLKNPRPLAVPVPAKGRLGLWTLPDDVAAEVERQVAL